MSTSTEKTLAALDFTPTCHCGAPVVFKSRFTCCPALDLYCAECLVAACDLLWSAKTAGGWFHPQCRTCITADTRIVWDEL